MEKKEDKGRGRKRGNLCSCDFFLRKNPGLGYDWVLG